MENGQTIEITEETLTTYSEAFAYLKDRYGITHSFNTFVKRKAAQGFGQYDFDLIVMTTLVGMGKFDEDFMEANIQSEERFEQSQKALEDSQEAYDHLIDINKETAANYLSKTIELDEYKREAQDALELEAEKQRDLFKYLKVTQNMLNDIGDENKEIWKQYKDEKEKILKLKKENSNLRNKNSELKYQIEELSKPWYKKIFKK